MIEQQNIEALRRAYEAFGRGDIDSVFGVFDENPSGSPQDLTT